jgi:hypothetical protein
MNHIPQVSHNRSSHKFSADIKSGQPDKLGTLYKITRVFDIGTVVKRTHQHIKVSHQIGLKDDQCLIYPDLQNQLCI